jgi:O-antigen ligase
MYVALTLGCLAYAYIRSPAAGKALLPFALVFVVALGLMAVPTDPDAMFLGIKAVGDLTSGTGRFEVWRYVLSTSFWQEPLLGYGFAIGDAIPRSTGINTQLGQLHNAHLSALLNLGLVGALLWLAFLATALLAILRVADNRRRAALAGAAAAYAVHQMAGGATLSSMMHPMWISQAFFFFLATLEAYDVRVRVVFAGART